MEFLIIAVIGFLSTIEFNFNFFANVAISILGVTAVFLAQRKNSPYVKWASVCGLAGQPFWFYIAYASSNGGIFILSCLYTWAWYTGFKANWFPEKDWGPTLKMSNIASIANSVDERNNTLTSYVTCEDGSKWSNKSGKFLMIAGPTDSSIRVQSLGTDDLKFSDQFTKGRA